MTKTAQALQTLIASLTLAQARAFEAQTDRLVWIETRLLDPLDIPRRHAERVERELVAILEADKRFAADFKAKQDADDASEAKAWATAKAEADKQDAAALRVQVVADLKEARGDYADALARRERVVCGENFVVRIGGFYARLETDDSRRVAKSQAAGLIGCSILTQRDAEAIARTIRNGNGVDRGEAVLYVDALRQEIASIDAILDKFAKKGSPFAAATV